MGTFFHEWILVLLVGGFLSGCTLSLSVEYGATAQKSKASIDGISVKGENDNVADTDLSASDTASLEWNDVAQAFQYQVSIYDSAGTNIICADQTSNISRIVLTGCSLSDRTQYKARIQVKNAFGNPVSLIQEFFDFTVHKLRFDKISPTVYAGDSLPLSGQYGLAPYMVTDAGSGWWNSGAQTYNVPPGTLGGTLEKVTLTDAENTQYSMNVKVRGFVDDIIVDMPSGVDDQVFTSDSVWTNAGNVFVGTTSSDAQGERWAVYRSSDQGTSWQKVDHYMGVDYEGESHVMGMTTDGTNVYVCGYVYSYNWNPWGGGATDPASGWVLRKSSDQGQTWTTIDYYAPVIGANHVCYDVAISPVTGFLYTGGYDATGWLVRESQDGGVTWTNILSESVGGTDTITQLGFSPNGDLWVMGSGTGGLNMRKGVFSGGVWSWSGQTASFPSGSTASSDYELGGTLQVVSDTTAYFAMTASSAGRIIKTSDGGQTWSTVYSRANGMLHGLSVTSNGTILANGGARKQWWPTSAPGKWIIDRSTDGGATWTTVYNRPAVDSGDAGYGLTLTSSPTGNEAMAFAYKDLNSQGMTLYSSNDGVSWGVKSEVNFIWKFYNELHDLVKLPTGDLIATGYAASMDGYNRWLVRKSSDQGATWTTLDAYLPVGANYANADKILRTSSGALLMYGTYYLSSTNHALIRRSTDSGSTWTSVLDLPSGTSTDTIRRIIELSNGDLLAVTYGTSGSSLIKSTDQGQNWTVTALANPPSVTNYKTYGISVLSDGSLWIMGLIENTNLVIMKSTDGGVTWTEKYRTSYSWIYETAIRENAGNLYFIHSNKVYTSADGGTSWSEDPIAGVWALREFGFDGSKLIVVGNNTAYAKSDYTSNWISLDESSTGPSRYNYEISGVLQCPDGGLCLNTTYEEPYIGTINLLRKIK